MTHVGIVYHSGFGHTKVLAQHIAQGAAQEPDVDASLFNVEDLKDDLVLHPSNKGVIYRPFNNHIFPRVRQCFHTNECFENKWNLILQKNLPTSWFSLYSADVK